VTKERFREKWSRLTQENSALKFTIVVLVALIMAMSSIIVFQSKRERTVVVPAFVDKKFYVESDKASAEYIEMMSKYAVELISSFTPQTVEERTADFLRFIAPSYYKDISLSFQKMIDDSKKYVISQYFIPGEMTMQGNTITIKGILRRYAENRLLEAAVATYRLTYEIQNGRFFITTYEKVEENI
jgi:conjugal transfer pilus assembly protein TraE